MRHLGVCYKTAWLIQHKLMEVMRVRAGGKAGRGSENKVPATVISGGLWCFGAVQIVGAAHERVVTGGGKASTKLERFKAINTFLGNRKRSLSA